MRKISRQSEVTPLNTIDHYLWNEKLGVTQLPPVDDSQNQQSTSSLPPQSSQAPTIDYDSSSGQSDMFGSGVSGQGQLIAPKAPMEVPRSTPAVGKSASISNTDPDHCPGCGKKIYDDDMNGYECSDAQRWCGTHHPKSCPDHEEYKTSAVSTLYGDVNPTPTTGDANNGSQAGRGNTPDDLPNGPDSKAVSPAAAGEEEGGAGLASELGEAASLAVMASKRWINSVLDPKIASDDEGHYKYIKHRNGKWVIIQKGTGKVLSTHDSREKAIASFKAMEMSKHGSFDFGEPEIIANPKEDEAAAGHLMEEHGFTKDFIQRMHNHYKNTPEDDGTEDPTIRGFHNFVHRYRLHMYPGQHEHDENVP